jgi:hypothetical protein
MRTIATRGRALERSSDWCKVQTRMLKEHFRCRGANNNSEQSAVSWKT